MKLAKFLTGALTLLLLTASAAPAAANHWMNAGDYGLKGEVKTIAESQVFLQKNGEEVTVPLRTISYDNDGKALRVITYKGPESSNDQGYRYDSQGRLVASGRYVKGGAFIDEIEYSYDSDGKLKQNRYLREDGAVFLSKVYRYDSAGNLVEEQQSAGGQIIATKKISFDRENNETVITTYGPDGQLLASEKSRVTKGGVDEQIWNYHGELGGYGIRKRTVTAEDNMVSTVCYLPGGSAYQNKVCDTVEGDSTKRTVYRADESVMMEIYFDAEGNMTMYSRFTPDGEIEKAEKYTYQYDEKANWTVRTVYERLNNQGEWMPTGETRRSFVYYH